MNKTILIVVIWLSCFANAHAENRLFPTDILNEGEIDAGISAEYQRLSTDFRLLGISATEERKITAERIGVRYGLGSDWHIGASLGYVSRDDIRTEWKSSGASFDNKRSYSLNPILWARYGIVNDKGNPFSLSGELMVSPKTTDMPHRYGAKLSAGWKNSDTLKIYSTYTITREDDTDTINRIDLGAYKAISDSITLIPHVGYTIFHANNYFHSSGQYNVGLSANIQITRNTYLVPTIANFGNSSVKSKDGFLRSDSMHNGTFIEIGLYHLF